MSKKNLQLTTPLQAIIFDCDGTLSSIEGINELAKINGSGAAVAKLTEQAMGQTGMTPEIYRQRLLLTQPTLQQIKDLGKQYCETISPDIKEVIQILQRLGKQIFIMSAGIQQAVNILAAYLNVPIKNVYAVEVSFDTDGHYQDFDHQSLLTYNDGKKRLAQKLSVTFPQIALVGDGLNDYTAHTSVTRFIGYGGHYFRQNLADLCDFYITTSSMAEVLPLCLTTQEVERLNNSEMMLYKKGLNEGAV